MNQTSPTYRVVNQPLDYLSLAAALREAAVLDQLPDPLPVGDVAVELVDQPEGPVMRLLAYRLSSSPAVLHQTLAHPPRGHELEIAALMFGEFLQLPGAPPFGPLSLADIPQSRTPNPES